jgi:hypothetical protein
MYEVVEVHGVPESEGIADHLPGVKGWAVYARDSKRLDSFIYTVRKEAQSYCDFQNEGGLIRSHWPDANDEDVQSLLTDDKFFPIVGQDTTTAAKEASPMWRMQKACETVARQRAGLSTKIEG